MKKWLNKIKKTFGRWWPKREPEAGAVYASLNLFERNATWNKMALGILAKKPVLLMVLIFLTSACGTSQYTAKTKASYIAKDGTTATYESDKDQSDFHVKYEVDPDNGKLRAVDISVGGSVSPAAAIAAALKQSSEALGLLKELLPLLKAGKVQ